MVLVLLQRCPRQWAKCYPRNVFLQGKRCTHLCPPLRQLFGHWWGKDNRKRQRGAICAHFWSWIRNSVSYHSPPAAVSVAVAGLFCPEESCCHHHQNTPGSTAATKKKMVQSREQKRNSIILIQSENWVNWLIVKLYKTNQKDAKWNMLYLQPEVVLSFVCNFSVVITDVAFTDQAVNSSLVGVSTVPQRPAVVEAEFVLWCWWKAAAWGIRREINKTRRQTWQYFLWQWAEASSPPVMAVHVLLEPVLEVAQLMLHSVNNLHGCVQIPTAQTIVDDSPHWVALDLTILT